MSYFLAAYRFVFAHKLLYRLNLHLYKLSLRGIGVLNSEGNQITGETHFFQFLKKSGRVKVVVDVGANDGGYTQELAGYLSTANFYCCEPHPETFKKMKRRLKSVPLTHLFNLGMSAQAKKAKLWDFALDATLKSTQPTSTLASTTRGVIEKLHHQKAMSYDITLTTLDAFGKLHKLDQIDFLKIDTEGEELNVLKGAKELLTKHKITIIQFEFNEMNAYTHTLFKDFYDILPDFTFYRLMPDGLIPLGPYRPLTHEIFGFQNVVAVSNQFQFAQ